jgi:hypothetical protein
MRKKIKNSRRARLNRMVLLRHHTTWGGAKWHSPLGYSLTKLKRLECSAVGQERCWGRENLSQDDDNGKRELVSNALHGGRLISVANYCALFRKDRGRDLEPRTHDCHVVCLFQIGYESRDHHTGPGVPPALPCFRSACINSSSRLPDTK